MLNLSEDELTKARCGANHNKVEAITSYRLLVLCPTVATVGTAQQPSGLSPAPPNQLKHATLLLQTEPAVRRTERLLQKHIRGATRHHHPTSCQLRGGHAPPRTDEQRGDPKQ
jgi:hypothetical protein